jgi:hypothetical protein
MLDKPQANSSTNEGFDIRGINSENLDDQSAVQAKAVPHSLKQQSDATPGKSEHGAVIRGREAWDRLKIDLTWEDWMLTGEALKVGRSECFNAAQTNSVDDKRYRIEFNGWLKANGFDDMDSAARTRLFQCMDHRTEIEEWRATLPLKDRLKLNHPQSVIRKWKAATSKEKTAQPPAKAGLRDENMRLQEALDAEQVKNRELERRQDTITEGCEWTWQDSPKDIAAVWYRLHPGKAVQAAREVMQLDKANTKKPAMRA